MVGWKVDDLKILGLIQGFKILEKLNSDKSLTHRYKMIMITNNNYQVKLLFAYS